MFNVKLKDGYIEEKMKDNMNAKKAISNVFVRAEKFEDLFQKDICNWSSQEIISFYKMLTSPSLEYLMVVNNILQNYTNYCMINGIVVDSQNHYSEITNELLYECLNRQLFEKRIVSREDLVKSIGGLANECDKFIMLGIFEGLYGKSGRDMCLLKSEDVEGNIVKLNSGKEVEVSDELISIINKSAITYEYYSFKPGSTRPIPFKEDDRKVIKAMFNATVGTDDNIDDIITYRRIYTKFINIKKELNLNNLSMNTLKESGRIHLIKEYMNKYNLEPDVAIETYKDDIYSRYGALSSIKRYVLKYKEELKG